MDIHAWLQQTEDRRSPDSTSDAVDPTVQDRPILEHFRKRRHSPVYSDTDPPRIREQTERRHGDRGRQEQVDIGSSITSHSQEVESSSSARYRRRPRRKTRVDRYNVKPPKVKERKPHQRARRSGRAANDADNGVVSAFELNARCRKRRLTLEPGRQNGIFAHGRSGKGGTREKGLPDLSFNEMRFLQHLPQQQDLELVEAATNDIEDRRKVDAEISAYFQSKTRGVLDVPMATQHQTLELTPARLNAHEEATRDLHEAQPTLGKGIDEHREAIGAVEVNDGAIRHVGRPAQGQYCSDILQDFDQTARMAVNHQSPGFHATQHVSSTSMPLPGWQQSQYTTMTATSAAAKVALPRANVRKQLSATSPKASQRAPLTALPNANIRSRNTPSERSSALDTIKQLRQAPITLPRDENSRSLAQSQTYINILPQAVPYNTSDALDHAAHLRCAGLTEVVPSPRRSAKVSHQKQRIPNLSNTQSTRHMSASRSYTHRRRRTADQTNDSHQVSNSQSSQRQYMPQASAHWTLPPLYHAAMSHILPRRRLAVFDTAPGRPSNLGLVDLQASVSNTHLWQGPFAHSPPQPNLTNIPSARQAHDSEAFASPYGSIYVDQNVLTPLQDSATSIAELVDLEEVYNVSRQAYDQSLPLQGASEVGRSPCTALEGTTSPLAAPEDFWRPNKLF